MIYHLLRFSFPDLQRVDPADRRKLWNDAFGHVLRQPGYWIVAGGLQVAVQVCLNIPVSRYARHKGFYGPFVEYVLPFSYALLAVILTVWVVRRGITRNLREELNRRGFPTCGKCGYNLTGNVSGICSECGSPIRA